MARHTIPHLDILEYALEGVITRIGINGGNPDIDDDTFEVWEQDRAEIERRIKQAKQRQEQS